MKRILLFPLIVTLPTFYILASPKTLACDAGESIENTSRWAPLKSSSFRCESSVKGKVKIFEALITASSSDTPAPQKVREQDKISSPGHVKKISHFFRSKSAGQLPKISHESKKPLGKKPSSTEALASPLPKSSPRLQRWVKSFTGLQKSHSEKSKGSFINFKKRHKCKHSENVELSSPTVNKTLTKQRFLNLESIEEDLKQKINSFDMVDDIINAHLERGTIDETCDKYTYVLKGDFEQLKDMHIKGLHYLRGQHSLKKKEHEDPMGIASHIQNMGGLLKTVGDEILWVTGNLESPLFETKLEDAKRKAVKAIKSEEEDSPPIIRVTHPSRKSRGSTLTAQAAGSRIPIRTRAYTEVSFSTPSVPQSIQD